MARPFPILPELILVEPRPLPDQSKGSWWELAIEDVVRVDQPSRTELSIGRVEVGRFMVVEVHRDHDSIEGADSGHLPTLFRG